MANSPQALKLILLLCNMVHQLDDNGTMAIVLPRVFFVSVVPKDIRQYLIQEKTTSMP
jgi:type I restriction-modification system DNA methylase subunit